jgi:hypothetical protein
MCVCAEIEKFKSFSRSFFFVAFFYPSDLPRQSITRLPTRSLSLSLALDIFSFLFSLSSSETMDSNSIDQKYEFSDI